jgi:hypothetical protein
VDREWQETFRNRMRGFEARRAPQPGEAAVSIKVRVASGCFHREHSPRAYELIDRSLAIAKLSGSDGSFGFEEHESGPEILVYLAVTTAGLSLAKSIVDLITAIIKARSEGIKKGDSPSDPLELIVRRVHNVQEFREETVLRVGHKDAVDEAKVERQLKDALRKLLKDEPSTRTPRKKH